MHGALCDGISFTARQRKLRPTLASWWRCSPAQEVPRTLQRQPRPVKPRISGGVPDDL